MDALSHILEDIHLRGAEYLYVQGGGQWGFGLKGQSTFHVVLNGPVSLILSQQERYELQTGDVAFIPAGAEHQLGHPAMADPEQHWLMDEFQGHRNDPISLGQGQPEHFLLTVRCLLDEDMGRPLLTSLPPILLIRQGLDGSGPEWLQLGLSFLAQETASFRPGRDTLINRLVGMFLIECVRDYIEGLPDSTDNWLSALSDPYLSPALSAIHAQPGKPWTVSELASLACLSRSAFHDRFAEVIGIPPLTYLTEHRLRLAARLLAQGDLGINRIGQRVGYTSDAAFSQAFRRQYQMTPSQYRKGRLQAAG